MRVHVTTMQGGPVQVRIAASGRFSAETGATETSATAPNPIAPEGKELIWGGGSFLVFLVIMRLFLFPKLKKGMDARYDGIQNDLESADATRFAAQADVAKYQAALDEFVLKQPGVSTRRVRLWIKNAAQRLPKQMLVSPQSVQQLKQN